MAAGGDGGTRSGAAGAVRDACSFLREGAGAQRGWVTSASRRAAAGAVSTPARIFLARRLGG